MKFCRHQMATSGSRSKSKMRWRRFDTRTEKFEVFRQPYDGPPPAEMEPNAPWPNLRYTQATRPATRAGIPPSLTCRAISGVPGRPLSKFDVETKKYTFFPEVPDTYGIAVDKEGNVWFAEFNSRDHHSIGKVDVKTNKVTKWTPPNSDTRPRRLKIDSQGMVWFGDYFGGNLTRFDPKTQQFKELNYLGPCQRRMESASIAMISYGMRRCTRT